VVHHPGVAGRREHDGELRLLAEQHAAELDLGDVAQYRRVEVDIPVGRTGTGQADLRLRTAVDIVEHGAGNTPPGDRTEIPEAAGAGEAVLRRRRGEGAQVDHVGEV
jgi:hypothetical protein